MHKKVHPELVRQLAQSDDQVAQVVVQLSFPGRPEDIPSPKDTTILAESLLHRVEERVGHSAIRHNVLPNLATLVVEADTVFLRSLIDQPEVVSALPNEMTESPFIPPERAPKKTTP